MIKTVFDLDVFRLSYELAMRMFAITRSFPKEEKYSLTDQLVRSSRSISVNIAEGWGKRVYENEFKRHLVYATGSLEETKVWLRFAWECGYIAESVYHEVIQALEMIGARLYKLFLNWRKL